MLTPKQRQFLKAQAHHLKPAIHIGKAGFTEGLAHELDQMLDSLELMKIKLNQNTPEDKKDVVQSLLAMVPGLEHVWTVGKTVLVFRASRTKPTEYALPNS